VALILVLVSIGLATLYVTRRLLGRRRVLELESVTVVSGAFRLREVNLAVAGANVMPCSVIGSARARCSTPSLGCCAESGRIRLDGTDLEGVPIERRGLGYVHTARLFPHLTVRDNLAYSARHAHSNDAVPTARGQAGRRDRPRRAAGRRPAPSLRRTPARGLVRRWPASRLVLLDEPFTALNESLRRELWWLMRELQRECG